MSFKITPEVLKKLEELSKTRVSSGLTFGEDKEFYVIDARIGFKPDATISSLTLAVSEDLKSIKLYTFSPFVNPAIADNIINLLKDGKILKIKCKVYGNRIIAITNVEVIENIEITPNINLADAIFDIVSTGSTLISNAYHQTFYLSRTPS